MLLNNASRLHLVALATRKTRKCLDLNFLLIYQTSENESKSLSYYLGGIEVPSKQRATSSGIGQGDRPRLAGLLCPEAYSRQGQRGHNNSSAIVRPLFGLAGLSKSRIWPKCNSEPTNLSRGIRKTPQCMRFKGSRQSLRISPRPETARATLNVFSPSVWVCYLFIPPFSGSLQRFTCQCCLAVHGKRRRTLGEDQGRRGPQTNLAFPRFDFHKHKHAEHPRRWSASNSLQ